MSMGLRLLSRRRRPRLESSSLAIRSEFHVRSFGRCRPFPLRPRRADGTERTNDQRYRERPLSALKSFRIVELAESVSGEYCGKLLADFGAEVIKIEHPEGGSPTRRLGP